MTLKIFRTDTLIAIVVVALAVVVFYGRIPLQGATLNTVFANRVVTSPWSQLKSVPTGNTVFFDSSTNFENYPYDLYVASNIRDGRFPLWDPYDGFGVPQRRNAHDKIRI